MLNNSFTTATSDDIEPSVICEAVIHNMFTVGLFCLRLTKDITNKTEWLADNTTKYNYYIIKINL